MQNCRFTKKQDKKKIARQQKVNPYKGRGKLYSFWGLGPTHRTQWLGGVGPLKDRDGVHT